MKTKKKTPIDLVAFWRRNYRNPKLVAVELNTGELVDVRVRDSSLYCDGMVFPVSKDGDYFYEQKAPKQRGKL